MKGYAVPKLDTRYSFNRTIVELKQMEAFSTENTFNRNCGIETFIAHSQL